MDVLSKHLKDNRVALISNADGYADDGEPVFSLVSIAVKLDIGMEEVRRPWMPCGKTAQRWACLLG